LEDLTIRYIQKHQQQEQEEPVLPSIDSHDLQVNLTGIDSYLQNLGDIQPDWEQNCPFRRAVNAVL
jgi:hypothetical protein